MKIKRNKFIICTNEYVQISFTITVRVNFSLIQELLLRIKK